MVRLALAHAYDKPVENIEEIWPLLQPPYDQLFDWLEDRSPRPNADGKAVFRPLMLAHPLDDQDISSIIPEKWLVEWKWMVPESSWHQGMMASGYFRAQVMISHQDFPNW